MCHADRMKQGGGLVTVFNIIGSVALLGLCKRQKEIKNGILLREDAFGWDAE